jgi:hypothetical protein
MFGHGLTVVDDRRTVEIYSDPELLALATREYDEFDDYGPVLPPEVPG